MTVSRHAPTGAGDGTDPYFFLSYARHHPTGEAGPSRYAEDTDDPDRWALRFFEDLSFEITELTTLPRGTQPGFMDREVRIGQRWQRRISEALAACRVFVPLYTPRYFASLSCASEWYLFQARQSAHELNAGLLPEAIIPVLWLPIPDTELPAAAQALQFNHRTLGEAYARHGFLQLIRVARYKDDYQLAVHALARHVVRVAHDGAPRAARPVDFTALHGRFETADGLFHAAGELVRRARDRPPLPLPGSRPQLTTSSGTEQLALPPGTGELRNPPSSTPGPPAEIVRSESSDTEPVGVPGGDASPSSSAEPVTAPDLEPAAEPAEAAVTAYLRAAHVKLAEWFTSQPAHVSSVDFDEFYFRTVHPAAKAALLRQLPPRAPAGPFPRPPRLRGDPDVDPPHGGAPHVP
ncbi:MAG: TIR domain-containing protein [Catenulispora sp.]|nr:TIR domain-containing protein [Catenulispora sp.]